jgi:hypothetical protein
MLSVFIERNFKYLFKSVKVYSVYVRLYESFRQIISTLFYAVVKV